MWNQRLISKNQGFISKANLPSDHAGFSMLTGLEGLENTLSSVPFTLYCPAPDKARWKATYELLLRRGMEETEKS